MARFDLSDRESPIIEELLPNKPRGVPRTDDRHVLNGIFYVLHQRTPGASGLRFSPERYPGRSKEGRHRALPGFGRRGG